MEACITKQPARDVEVTFSVPEFAAPAVRSAIEDISNQIGARLEGTHSNSNTQALTDAAIGLGRLRAALTKAIPKASPYYDIP